MDSTMTIALSPGQVDAKEKVAEWLNAAWHDANISGPTPDAKMLFKLQGYAGTGKTTVIRSLLSEWKGIARFAAFTGKAALVMRKNGLPATTIHSLIYKPIEPNKIKCEELFKKIKETADAGEKKRLYQQLEVEQKVTFDLKAPEESDLSNTDLLVLDECSMVNDDMLRDLQTFGVPILALGDPGQLPPIDGTGALVRGTPDVFLTEIHRQAEGNPIIDYATRARSGMLIPFGANGDSLHTYRSRAGKDLLLTADQVLTGKNIERRKINRIFRELKGYKDRYPEIGEKVICLRNDKGLGIFNGMIGYVKNIGDLMDAYIELQVEMEAEMGKEPALIKVRALRAHFDEYFDKDALKNVRKWEFKDNHEFNFGYCITVHKSQGSQWDRVVVWDDGFLHWEPIERRKWLYTAITRAAQSVVLAS